MRGRSLVFLLCATVASCTGALPDPSPVPASPAAEPRLEIWHGTTQRVVGEAQPDFNLMGHVHPPDELLSLTYAVEDGIPVEMNTRAYRRIARAGDFNADIPLDQLRPGPNRVVLAAHFAGGTRLGDTVLIHRQIGSPSLPFHIDWSDTPDPQTVGQFVDGRWRAGPAGLTVVEPGYDRIFLVGSRDWQDYDVRVPITIHQVLPETSPLSGGNGVGIILRFAGHVIGGPGRFPISQPKWGYQPFGAIGWLRWRKGHPDEAPALEFYPGDSNARLSHGQHPVELGRTSIIRMDCTTLPDAPGEVGVTRYRFRIWPEGAPEPEDWAWEQIQASPHALRRGGVALLAHHVLATFGDVAITPR